MESITRLRKSHVLLLPLTIVIFKSLYELVVQSVLDDLFGYFLQVGD
jgi:hypothetical protein